MRFPPPFLSGTDCVNTHRTPDSAALFFVRPIHVMISLSLSLRRFLPPPRRAVPALALVVAVFALSGVGSHGQDALDVPDALQQSLTAHGGLDVWSQYGTLEYDFTRVRDGSEIRDHQLVDLVARRLRITADAYTIVHDGSDVGIVPGVDALDYGPGPRFYSMTYFYFFALPFVLADPGTTHEAMGTETVDGTTYEVVRVGYESGVGDAPDDVYLAYIDAETHQLAFVRYSVTYGDIAQDEPNSTIYFREWTETGGLVVPARATFHPWDDGAPGEQVAEVRYENITFASERPPDDTFVMPAEAEMIAPPGR